RPTGVKSVLHSHDAGRAAGPAPCAARRVSSTARDPDFLATCEKRKLMVDGATGEEIDKIVRETLRLAPAVAVTTSARTWPGTRMLVTSARPWRAAEIGNLWGSTGGKARP